MKALLIIAALAGMSFTSYGHAKHKCAPKKKVVAHASTACHNCGKKSKISSSSLAGNSREAIWDRLLTCSRNKKALAAKAHMPDMTLAPSQPCFSYRKNNIVVTECPGMKMRPGDLDVIMQSTYGGYRPGAMTTTVNPMTAPQPNVLNPYRGTAPADGNFCGPDCVLK